MIIEMEFTCHIDQSGLLIDRINEFYVVYDIVQTPLPDDMVLTTCKLIDRVE